MIPGLELNIVNLIFFAALSIINFEIQEYHAEFYSEHYFTVLNGFIRQKNGYIDLNDEPGLGLELNEDEIAKHPPIKKPTSSGGTIRGI